MKDLFSLAGKVALVTGGSRGIGQMIARGLVSFGAKVYLVSRSAEACERAAHELSGIREVVALPADLSQIEEIARVGDVLTSAEDRLHVLVCNAGTVWSAPLEEFPEQGWDKVANLNIKSPFFLVQRLLPLLRRAASPDDPARIINVASIDGLHVPLTETYSYSAAKAGLLLLTRMLARRLAGDHITVNAIAPGAFVTKMTAKAFEERGEEFLARVPLRRFGVAEDIAGVAVLLASRAGAYIDGATIPVDGGWLGTL